MKIALLTIWHCYNYGAEMQAYATCRALTSLGHDVEIIDLPLHESIPPVKKQIARLIGLLSPQRSKFNRFWSAHIPCKTRTYSSVEDLKKAPPVADIYMVGSDQVWNRDITNDYAPAFFLDFGADNIRRISFSSSFGVSEWSSPAALTAIVKKRLKQFSAVSCREKTGIKILNETFGIDDAANTLDPTLLFDDYSEITGTLSDKNIVAYYPLSPDDHALKPIADKVADLLSAHAKNANPYTLVPHTSLVWDRNSISEWLRTIAEARFVITQSFHGLVFSILHHRQFAVINLAKHSRQSRILDLLSALGLEDRYFSSETEFIQSNIIFSRVDYASVDAKLNKMRNDSWNYLKEATT